MLRAGPALERLGELPAADADRHLRAFPGVGLWTSAEVRARAFGDPDAISFGDYHVAKDVCFALTGRRPTTPRWRGWWSRTAPIGSASRCWWRWVGWAAPGGVRG